MPSYILTDFYLISSSETLEYISIYKINHKVFQGMYEENQELLEKSHP